MPATRLSCPSCGVTLKTALPAGKRIRCPKCSQAVTVPDEEDEADSTPAPRRPSPVSRKAPAPSPPPPDEDEDEPTPEPESVERPRKKKKSKKQQKMSPALLWGLVGGGGAVAVLAVVLIATGAFSKKEEPKDKPPLSTGKPDELGVPFLDEAKSVPRGREWSREVTSRMGGAISFRVTGQPPFAVTIVTDRAYKAMLGGTPPNKADILLTVDAKEQKHEGKVTLPAGSSYFIIENQTQGQAEIRLQCFEAK